MAAHAEDEQEPVTVEMAVVVQGAHLGKRRWAPIVIFDRDGKAYFSLQRGDREFARLLGLRKDRLPWHGNTWPEYLQTLLKQSVDRAISEANLAERDPMADEGCAIKRARREMADSIPEVLELIVPPLEGLPEYSMNVLSAPDRVSVCFELTAPNLVYLSKAVHLQHPHVVKKKRPDQSIVVDKKLAPNVRWNSRKRQLSVPIYGETRKKFERRTVPPCSDEATEKMFILNVAQDLQKLHDENLCSDEEEAVEVTE